MLGVVYVFMPLLSSPIGLSNKKVSDADERQTQPPSCLLQLHSSILLEISSVFEAIPFTSLFFHDQSLVWDAVILHITYPFMLSKDL